MFTRHDADQTPKKKERRGIEGKRMDEELGKRNATDFFSCSYTYSRPKTE
jgi:hypothetical protein